MLISLANKEQFETVKKTIIDTVVANIEAEFAKSVAVEITGNDNEGLRMKFSQPNGNFLSTLVISLPPIIISKTSLKNE